MANDNCILKNIENGTPKIFKTECTQTFKTVDDNRFYVAHAVALQKNIQKKEWIG